MTETIRPHVAIVGRPNVGKSTLFNRLAGKRLALVHDRPGVTRDRREAEAQLGDLVFMVIDTAGFEEADDTDLEGRMRQQTERAIAEADVCLFVVDVRSGLTALESVFAQVLRRAGKPVILVANKCEARAGQDTLAECFALGFGEAVPLSAEHGEGLAELYDALAPLLHTPEEPTAVEGAVPPLRLAIAGRPNVGKSSLLNRLIGQDRFVTGPEAGITRDAVAVTWRWQGRDIRFFDTAGLRKRAKVSDDVERMSTADTVRAIRFAEIVVLVVDATQPFERQDMTVADLILREGRGLVVAVNKWDLVEDPAATKGALREALDERLPQARGVPLVFVSALTGRGLDTLMPAIATVERRWTHRVPTAVLNRWLEGALDRHPPPLVKGRRLKVRYATQLKARPPAFALFTSRPSEIPEAYRRYLINGLRDAFDLDGVPIRLILRKGDNPFVSEGS